MSYPEDIKKLIRKSQRAETTVEEEMVLLEWASANPIDAASLDKFNDFESIIEELKALDNIPTEGAEDKVFEMWEREKSTMRQQEYRETGKAVTTAAKRRHLFTYIAAASVIAIIGFAYWWLNKPVKKTATQAVADFKPTKDASPGTDKAKLTLADGSTHIIEDTAKGNLAQLYNVAFTKERGSVICKTITGSPEPPDEVLYHSLIVPNGGCYQLVLRDGSKIWLNSASRLQFPTVDTGNTRVVILEGEAYFEVAATNAKHFKVKVNGADVDVTGTKFNIRAYADGSIAKASLAEGQLNVFSGGSSVKVSPSQSASFYNGGMPTVEQEPNMYKVLAWKDKKFWWNGDSLTTALREVARWYNVTLQFDDMPASVVGTVIHERSKPLTEVMDILMTNTGFTYELIGNILYIRKIKTALRMQNERKYHNPSTLS